MPWIWNDKDFIPREKAVFKANVKFGIPLNTISFIFWYLLVYNVVTTLEFIFLVVLSAGWVYSIISSIYKFPSSYIDEKNDSNSTKYSTRLTIILVSTLGLYLFVIGILKQYYPFFEQFVCCDLVKNFTLEKN